MPYYKDVATLEELESIMNSAESGLKFPHIVHLVWFNDDPEIPSKWADSPSEWQARHQSWTIFLWNRELGRKFVERYEPDFYSTYINYPYEIQRIDSIRYCFLKRYGGVYSDLDAIPLFNMESKIDANSPVYLVHSHRSSLHFMNGFMVSKSKQPFWNELIQQCKIKSPWWCIGKHLTIIHTPGPWALTRTANATETSICVLPLRFNSLFEGENKIFQATLGDSWHSWDSKIIFLGLQYKAFSVVIIALIILIAACLSYSGFCLLRREFFSD